MRKPKWITFTGYDDRTDFLSANLLEKKYPIEWGVLFSLKNKDAQYPSLQTFDAVKELDGRKALHMCGSAAREFWYKEKIPEDLIKNNRFNIFQRIQVNGWDKSREGFDTAPKVDQELIVQSDAHDFDVQWPVSKLFDKSGGRGIVRESLPAGIPGGIVGYAGGITPDNVLEFLSKIPDFDGEFWIDMETGVRTNGWFDLSKVEKVCKIVYD